ncbi:Retrovirus-related Pol polyprotein from transposon opus [Gossypium australe]|uniref:Retrovirus-related Pol polyprotein from transposon opus n=1 Tax=Gossypium australe TaxID=47621 RepID=A0A5B6VKW4_9ROSI|nr:Retrovirus-related Pol polyprotein from transposon opus [Gossypium australe]
MQKYLREMMSRRKKIRREERFASNAKCSVVVSRRVLPKLNDPSSFTIPIEIGGALYDLGASINLMPLSIYYRLGLGYLGETLVTFQLAERSLVHPNGVLKDVLVRVRQFILPVDFIILEFEEDLKIPNLLGRPFLATSKDSIDVGKGEMTMEVG